MKIWTYRRAMERMPSFLSSNCLSCPAHHPRSSNTPFQLRSEMPSSGPLGNKKFCAEPIYHAAYNLQPNRLSPVKGGLWNRRAGQLIWYTLGFHHILRETLVSFTMGDLTSLKTYINLEGWKRESSTRKPRFCLQFALSHRTCDL